MTEAPGKLNWVKARSTCSYHQVFKELELGAQDDVEFMQSLTAPNERTMFRVASTSSSRFAVIRVDDPILSDSRSVSFALTPDAIVVYGEDQNAKLTATLTLTNEGECKLKVGSQELHQWQFRRMALESLFFSPKT